MSGTYTLGTEVTLFGSFLDEDGSPADPGGVTFTIELPDESTEVFVFGVDAEVTKTSTGNYELAYVPPASGTYNYKITGTDPVVAVHEGTFTVLRSALSTAAALHGPCETWVGAEDVVLCCNAEATSDSSIYVSAAATASELLYELSGRQFAGVCHKTVRPCRVGCGCNWQVLSRGYVVWHDGWSCDGVACGCSALSQVELSGYPVREVTQVKIDGVVLDEDEYRLDRHRYLVRKNNENWPGCQNLSLDDDEEGTWSVTYTYGAPPPLAGAQAAAELACEIYRSCTGDEECVLPSGVSRIQRQGIVIERNAFAAWGRQEGIWRTGMPLVDLFLNTYNPSGMRKRPTFITPGRRHFPLPT